MKLASYNVENLFLRARALNDAEPAASEAIKNHAQLNIVLQKKKYSASDKKKIVTLLKALGLQKADDRGEVAILRQNRGHLLKRPKTGPVQIVAAGRDDWIGWGDLKTEEVNDVATRMTARVVHDLKADVLAVIEAESRPALLRFAQGLVTDLGAKSFGRRGCSQKLVAVVGDFNDTPSSKPLAPLMKTDLKDVTQHPSFGSDGRPGTYQNGTASNKIDYILLSPALFALVKAGGIFRKGVWGGTHGDLFEHYEEMTKASEAASDHAAIWAEIDV